MNNKLIILSAWLQKSPVSRVCTLSNKMNLKKTLYREDEINFMIVQLCVAPFVLYFLLFDPKYAYIGTVAKCDTDGIIDTANSKHTI